MRGSEGRQNDSGYHGRYGRSFAVHIKLSKATNDLRQRSMTMLVFFTRVARARLVSSTNGLCYHFPHGLGKQPGDGLAIHVILGLRSSRKHFTCVDSSCKPLRNKDNWACVIKGPCKKRLDEI